MGAAAPTTSPLPSLQISNWFFPTKLAITANISLSSPACTLPDHLHCILLFFAPVSPHRPLSTSTVDHTHPHSLIFPPGFHGPRAPPSYRHEHSYHGTSITEPSNLLPTQGFQARDRPQVRRLVLPENPIPLHSQIFQGRCSLRFECLVLQSNPHLPWVTPLGGRCPSSGITMKSLELYCSILVIVHHQDVSPSR